MVESCLAALLQINSLFLFQGISQLLNVAAVRAGQCCPGQEVSGQDGMVGNPGRLRGFQFPVLTELTRSQ